MAAQPQHTGSTTQVQFLLVPKLTDTFEVPGGEILTWEEISRTRPVTPLAWWRNDLERRGTIPNALEWLRHKKYILSGEATALRIVHRESGEVVGWMRPEDPSPTLDVHFSRRSSDE